MWSILWVGTVLVAFQVSTTFGILTPPVPGVEVDGIKYWATNNGRYYTAEEVSADKTDNKIINFDDLYTSPTNPTVPMSNYTHFNFTSFTALDPIAAYATSKSPVPLSLWDLDCASSAPNALIGSRSLNPGAWPRFMSDANSLHSQNYSEYFNLRSLSIKVLGNFTYATGYMIEAWEVHDLGTAHASAKNMYSLFTSYLFDGHVRQRKTDFLYWKGWGEKVNVVVMYAEDYEGRDVPICVDDVEIKLVNKGENEEDEHHGFSEWPTGVTPWPKDDIVI